MVLFVSKPTQVKAVGTKPKIIEEFIGRVNSGTEALSIAKMQSPQGWEEPGQTPAFDEFTLVLAGTLRVATQEEIYEVSAGQAIIAPKGEWVRYSSPHEGGAEYVAVCLPAFSLDTVHRDDE